MEYSFWRKQTTDKPLFPDIEWSKPEQKSKAGRLGIIGGNSLGFAAVAESYSTCLKTGAGEVKILLPESLKKMVPHTMTDVIYGATNPSGGLSRDALVEMKTMGAWSTGILLIGDAGKNSETSIVYEDFISSYSGPMTITRDAVDLLKNCNNLLVNRPNTVMIVSFAQLQKLFQSIYYPIVLTFSMQLTNLAEALHKFTITYPVTIAVLHQETLLIANSGQIISTPYENPMKIWRGETASKAATYGLWSPSKPMESLAASLLS